MPDLARLEHLERLAIRSAFPDGVFHLRRFSQAILLVFQLEVRNFQPCNWGIVLS